MFEGIGGFSLAARMVGWQTVAWCEINTFCQKVLTKHFPEAKQHADIKELDGSQYRGSVDIITGGFPCQPYSLAGKRKGTDDERHLWPEMRRVYREVAPRWIVGENVYGLVNWNDGLVFEQVQADLEDDGYEVLPYILPAAGVNAPHQRYRVWFVAHARRDGHEWRESGGDRCEEIKGEGIEKERKRVWQNIERTTTTRATTNSNESGLAIWKDLTGHHGEELKTSKRMGDSFDRFPSVEPGIRGGDDGVPNRVERIKALGNAIVPQVAVQIFKAINEYESLIK